MIQGAGHVRLQCRARVGAGAAMRTRYGAPGWRLTPFQSLPGEQLPRRRPTSLELAANLGIDNPVKMIAKDPQ